VTQAGPEDLRSRLHPVGPAEIQLPCAALPPTLAFFTGLGFRVETIFPAEEPQVASLSGFGLRLRLAPGGGDPGLIRLACVSPPSGPERFLTAPNGTRVELVDRDPPVDLASFHPRFVLTRRADGPAEGEGRAGMIYRDLIPDRLGGRYIASHIVIPDGGPVGDWVHFHKIAFQLIFCRRGWARLVYEDQGPPFLLEPGDCVVQPPGIRHRVLESGAGLEVVEIGCPALHETHADHDMELPTGRVEPHRDFGGQRFLRHVAADTPWFGLGDTGFERRETGVGAATAGAADARTLRPARANALDVAPHEGELLFGFVLEGSAVLERAGERHALAATDAFVIPPGEPWRLRDSASDLALLEIVSPASQR
jgi:mannose-6-phosphate isomerase-like protein (cupin superfamily)